MKKKLYISFILSGVIVLCWFYRDQSSIKPTKPVLPIVSETVQSRYSTRAEKYQIEAPLAPVTKDWVTEYKPLSPAEEQDFSIVPEQIQRYFYSGKMDPARLDEFRSSVFKFDNRGLAHVGRTILFESETLAATKEGSDKIVSLIDTLSYFARRSEDYPLAVDIIRDLATKPINLTDTQTPQEKSKAVVTLQLFEQFARYRPKEAEQFILTNIDKQHRQPYIYFYKTGLILAGIKGESLTERMTAFM